MNNRRQTKRALLTSIMALVMCVVMLVGTTFAWFTDTASTNVNKIQAGNLDVELVGATTETELTEALKWTQKMSESGEVAAVESGKPIWEPGCTFRTEGFRIKNNGSLALKWKVNINRGVKGVNDKFDLKDVIDFSIVNQKEDGTYEAIDLASFEGKLSGAEGSVVSPVYYLQGHMRETADNNYQGLTLDGIAITVYAAQQSYEFDSNGNTYDEKAEYAVEVRNESELYRALENDDNVILVNDITLSGNWIPAGNGTRDGSSFEGDSYDGIFNGNGKTISNVKTSLFGVLTGTVKNVTITAEINAAGSDSMGAVAGILVGGTISDVTVNGSVTGEKAVGGIVGRVLAEGTVRNCTNNATVESTSGGDAAGGIVGKAYYTVAGKEMNITGCKNTGTVNGKYAAGGIVGFSAANVKDCVNSGAIVMSGSSASAVGGIVGEQTNYGTISGNKNTKEITVNGSTNVNVGGIIGWIRYQNNAAAYANNMTIVVSGNENSGNISSGNGTGLGTGGIVGLAYNQAKVDGNKNTAVKISGGTFAAGIVGGLQVDAGNLTINESVRFIVTGNTSATTLENISGNCKDLFAYNNEPGNNAFADTSGNTLGQ